MLDRPEAYSSSMSETDLARHWHDYRVFVRIAAVFTAHVAVLLLLLAYFLT